ncbi:uncharacterized protein LOC127704905 [Mytilus californianus]|uniref:uncharacterized protein LOC127704905 n=1 Tax=Mytilus californianus TaxID=6549 RepID=UPI0022462C9A|nr:uncharacterized protein LOC127704905 [Mytilus californianus]
MSTTEKPYWGLGNSTRSTLPTRSVESTNVTELMSTTEKPYWGLGNSTRSTLPTRSVESPNVTDSMSTTDKPYLRWGSSTTSTLITGREGSLNVSDLVSSTKKPYLGWGNSPGGNLNEGSSPCTSSVTLVGSILGVLLVLVSIIFIIIIIRLRKTALRKRHRHTTDTIRAYEDIGSVSADHSYTAMQHNTGRGSYIQPRSPYINHHANTLISRIEECEFTGEKSEDNQYSQIKDHHHYVDIIT